MAPSSFLSDFETSCTVGPDTTSPLSKEITQLPQGTYQTLAFYLDSSGRANVKVPLQLTGTGSTLSNIINTTKCMDTYLQNQENKHDQTNKEPDTNKSDAKKDTTTQDNQKDQQEEQKDTNEPSFRFGVDAKVTLTFGTGEAISALVETVTIRNLQIINDDDNNTTKDDVVVRWETDILVRVSKSQGERFTSNNTSSRVKTNLEITAYLEQRNTTTSTTSTTNQLSAGLQALAMASFPDKRSTQPSSASSMIPTTEVLLRRLVPPLEYQVVLTHALSLSVTSVPAQRMGQTLLAITMQHSNTHDKAITVTNITLHPGHSTEQTTDGSSAVVSDMSKSVRWMYKDQCDPGLPLVLHPHEAISTIVLIDASEDRKTRTFSSPLSVTSHVGGAVDTTLVAAAQVTWTTCRAALEPSDTFRVDLSLAESCGVVGAPSIVNLEITNHSPENRDVMILVENSGEVGVEKTKAVKTAVVSEKAGQKFGVWGLVDDGMAEIPEGIDRELLSMDVALLVGEIKANQSTKAALRFIPLKEGTIAIPKLKLIDRRRGKWYSAAHKLRLVVQSA